jgi:peptide/nickel transport system substrate-binding protein
MLDQTVLFISAEPALAHRYHDNPKNRLSGTAPKKYIPLLAKAWRRVAPDTLEFDLRDDVKFHNGNAFDADDVVATVNYVKDLKVKLTFKRRYSWVKRVEKLGKYKVRIVSKKVNSVDLGNMAYRIVVWDGETMAKLDKVSDYGRLSPVGTGSYKVLQVDKNKGTFVERYEGYNSNKEYNRAGIKRIHAISMPDRQTQVAQLMVGGIDLIRNVQPDTALRVTAVPAPSIFYIALDSVNKSGNKAISDPRVRLAIHKAIDRDKLIKHLVPGGEVATKLDALCFKGRTIACKYSVKAPEYDLAGAKKLMIEAGYPNGFDLDYLVYAPMVHLGEAVAGELRKIGVRAKITPATIGLYRRKQGQGKLQAWSILFPTGSHPDAANILGVYFNGGGNQYYGDPSLRQGIADAAAEFTVAKRAEHYQKVLDRVNEMHYVFPITSIPSVYAHSKDVKLVTDSMSTGDVWIGNFEWN